MKCSGAFLLIFFACQDGFAQPDPATLVKQSIAAHERDWKEGAKWRYKQVDITCSGDEKHEETSEIIPLNGQSYERLVAKDGKPLSQEEQRKEEEKYQKALEKARRETPAERAARIRKRNNEWEFLRDVPNAYTFAIVGEESVNGRPAWIVTMTPRPDFTPTTSRGSMLKHIAGKLWIDKEETQWAKAEAHIIGTLEIGWILARIGPGAEIQLHMSRVADNLWLPAQLEINGSAKVLLVHKKNLNEKLYFSDFARAGNGPGVQLSGNTNLTRARQ